MKEKELDLSLIEGDRLGETCDFELFPRTQTRKLMDSTQKLIRLYKTNLRNNKNANLFGFSLIRDEKPEINYEPSAKIGILMTLLERGISCCLGFSCLINRNTSKTAKILGRVF